VKLANGKSGTISYKNKQFMGGELDVDMHCDETKLSNEPVDNIFWKKPAAGEYTIRVVCYKKRGSSSETKFRAILKREDEDDLSVEGVVGKTGKKPLTVFRFSVDADGVVTVGQTKEPKNVMKSAGVMKTVMKAVLVMKVVPEPKAKILMRKPSKVLVFEGAKLKTKKGLKKEDLLKNKQGKIVSAKKSAQGKSSKWMEATAKARALKGYTGFKSIKKGTSFYEETKKIFSKTSE